MTTTALSAPTTAPSASTPRRATWALWGTAAGLTGFLTNMPFAQTVSDDVRRTATPSELVAQLDRGLYHASAITGFLTVAFLLFFAAGLSRWARQQASDSLALRVAPAAVTASAGALIAAYGVKGMLSSYLVGGFNEQSYGDTARYTYFLLDDLAGYYSWWGVTVAAACFAYLAFRERLIPRWVGAFAALVTVIPLVFLAAVGFTGISGIVAPVFLLIGATGMSRMRS